MLGLDARDRAQVLRFPKTLIRCASNPLRDLCKLVIDSDNVCGHILSMDQITNRTGLAAAIAAEARLAAALASLSSLSSR